MGNILFNEEYLTRHFQRCKSPLELEGEVEYIIGRIQDRVSVMWKKMDAENCIRLAGHTTVMNGKTYSYLPDETREVFHYSMLPYKSIGAYHNYDLYFEEGEFHFFCPIRVNGEDFSYPEPIINWIDDQLFALQIAMPSYLTVKGKLQRLYAVQRTALEAQTNALLQKQCMGARMDICEDYYSYSHVWNMCLSWNSKTADPVTSYFRYCYYPRYKRSLFRMLESLFCFFGKSYWLSLAYKNPYTSKSYSFEQHLEDYVNEDTGEIITVEVFPDAPAHAYPFHEAFLRSVPDMRFKMRPIEDSSGQEVLMSLDLSDGWTRFTAKVWFKFDFSRYSLEDCLIVINRLDKDLFALLRQIKKTGNTVDLSVLIDFEKALTDSE